MIKVIMSILLFFSTVLLAEEGWISLNAKSNPFCFEKTPCILMQSKDKTRAEVSAVFTFDGKKRILKSISIKGRSNQEFDQFDNFPTLFDNEKIGIFATDLNGDGYQDIALQASLALKSGHHYFYFIYNPKKQEFVQTLEQVEALTLLPNKKLKGKGTETLYSVNKSFQVVPTKKK